MSCGVIADREAATAIFDAVDDALEDAIGLDSQMLCTQERLALLERFEKVRRRLCAGEHRLITQLQQEATPEELGGKLCHAIADATLISRAEAARRVRDAADLGQRRALTGEPLAPVLAATTDSCNPAAGPPAPKPTATPNGSHHPKKLLLDQDDDEL